MASSQDIFNQLGFGVCLVGLDQRVRLFNNRASEIFGVKADLAGKAYANVLPAITQNDQYKGALHNLPLVQVLHSGQAASYELAINRKNGSFKLSAFVSPLKNEQGKIIGAVECYLPAGFAGGGGGSPLDNNLLNNLKTFVSQSALKHIETRSKAPGSITAAKRYRSICFIDIVGFTSLAERLNEHATVHILNIFFNRINRTVAKHHGDIDKFLGDAALITFVNSEGSVRCAMDIIMIDLPVINSQIAQFYKDIPDIQVHVGINSGWVIVGEIGGGSRRDFTVIGDDVNLASRIQDLSPPNEIWISGPTAGNLAGLRQLFKEAEYLKVKGKSQQVNTYRFDPSAMKVDNRVLVYEKNKALRESLAEKLRNLGAQQVQEVEDENDIGQSLAPTIDTMVVGPSTGLKDMGRLKAIAEKAGFHKEIMLPVSKDVSPEAIAKLEKLGIRTYVPYADGEEMERSLGNALRNQTVHNIEAKTVADSEDKAEPPPSPEPLTASPTESQIQQEHLGTEDGFALQLSPDYLEATVEKSMTAQTIGPLIANVFRAWEFEYKKDTAIELVLNFDNNDSADIIAAISNTLDAFLTHPRVHDSHWAKARILIKTDRHDVRDAIDELSNIYNVALKPKA